MGYFSQLDADLREDDLGPDPYDEHVDACAHLPQDIWDQVRHLPTVQALALGGELLFVKRQQEMNKAIVASIWKKDSSKSLVPFDAKAQY